jgi:hypothetical protein
MGAIVSGRHAGEERALKMSNGGYSVLHEVLAIAASRLAQTNEQRYWALWIASHDLPTFGHGISDYDISEMPWTHGGFEAERTFLLAVIDAALGRLGWESLGYSPPRVAESLAELRELVAVMRASDIGEGELELDPPSQYPTCEKHGVVLHDLGCIVCNNAQ